MIFRRASHHNAGAEFCRAFGRGVALKPMITTPCKIELEDEMVVALAVMSDFWLGETSQSSIEQLSHDILCVALANPYVLNALVRSHVNYRDAEQLGDKELLLARLRERYDKHMPAHAPASAK